MLATALMLVFVSVAAVTDVLYRKIYNWTTYSGILCALAIGGVVGTLDTPIPWLGTLPFYQSAGGLLACAGIMLVCYVFFPVGGGDVKLLAMLGAFLGVEPGIETLLWTLVLGGALGLIILVWRTGTLTLLRRFIQYGKAAVRMRGFTHLRDADAESSSTSLFLAPAALAAVMVVYIIRITGPLV
ncbi:MAG: A24 family peptidase [Planctomycetales bacterium]